MKKKTTNEPKKTTPKKTTKTIEPEVEMVDLTQPDESTQEELPSIGLGDTIAKVTDFLGIKKCASCEQRQKKLNKMFPWLNYEGQKLQGEEVELMKRVNSNPSTVASKDVDSLFALYNEKLQTGPRKLKRCTCVGLLKTIVDRLNLLMPEDE